MRAPGRQFPGLLIQGDSLIAIVGDLREAIELFDKDRNESLECLKNALDELKWRLDWYTKVCGENGFSFQHTTQTPEL